MIRRRSLHVVAVWLATLVAAGCQDNSIPTAVPPRATPRAPSYGYTPTEDVTYPVLHGTLRIFDIAVASISDGGPGGRGPTSVSVPAGATIRVTGKWQLGPVTNVNECPQCDYALYIGWWLGDGFPRNQGLAITRSPELNPESGQAFAFDWTTHAPNARGDYFINAGSRVGSTFDPEASGFAAAPNTNSPGFEAVSFHINVSGPTMMPVVAGTLGANGWYASDVSVSWEIDNFDVNNIRATGQTGCDAVTVSTDTDGSTLTCSVTSSLGKAVRSVTIKRDTKKPTLAPTVSPNPVAWKGSATASPNATDAGSGIDSQSCGAVSTSVVGQFSVNCTATDKAGNTTTTSVNYVVSSPYRFSGFVAPVDPMPMVNTAKAGSAIPVKFSLGGNFGLAIFAAGYPKWQQAACSASPNDNPVDEVTAATTANSLTYDARADQYAYVWKSDKAWAGTCGDLMIKLADGSVYSARFQFKK